MVLDNITNHNEAHFKNTQTTKKKMPQVGRKLSPLFVQGYKYDGYKPANNPMPSQTRLITIEFYRPKQYKLTMKETKYAPNLISKKRDNVTIMTI